MFETSGLNVWFRVLCYVWFAGFDGLDFTFVDLWAGCGLCCGWLLNALCFVFVVLMECVVYYC